MKIICLFLFQLVSLSLVSQTVFCKAVGDSANEIGYSILNTSDGGYIMAGKRDSAGAATYTMFLVKFDSTGNVNWSKAIGGGVGNGDVARSIVETDDGGYAAAGYTYSYGQGSADLYIAKTDSTGNLMWTRTVGDLGADVASDIVKTADGGFLVAGELWADGYLVKLDSAGAVTWTKTIGGGGQDCFNSIKSTNDGGFIAGGYTRSYGQGSADSYFVKLDSTGNITWTSVIGDSSSNSINSIIQTSDNGYAAFGINISMPTGQFDLYFVKLDSTGNLMWSKTYDSGAASEYGMSLVQTNDNGYMVTGLTAAFAPGSSNLFILKLDSSGIPMWTKTTSGSGEAYSIIKTSDGGFALGGNTSGGVYASDLYIIKLDSNGTNCCTNNIGSFSTSIPACLKTSGGSIGSFGQSGVGGNFSSANCVTTNLCNPNSIAETSPGLSAEVYPNPFSSSAILKSEKILNATSLTIYNSMGQEVKSINNITGLSVIIDRENLSSGLYFARLTEVNKLITTVKLVITD
jgi:hypothetical protein